MSDLPPAPFKIIDSRDYALIIVVDPNGVADVLANGISRGQAAEWLRAIADQFAAEAVQS
jgi:hypothetical protein